jgi:hypothetical protein
VPAGDGQVARRPEEGMVGGQQAGRHLR